VVNIPNLRPRAFGYFAAWIKRNLLRLGPPLPPVTPRERRIFLIYAPLAALNVALLLSVMGLLVGSILIGKLGALGWIILGLFALALVRRPVRRLVRAVADRARAGAWKKRPTRRTVLVAGVALVVAAAAFLTPWTVRVRGTAVVEPTQRIWLRPADGGWIAAVLVAEGQILAAGDPVIRLRSPELELEMPAEQKRKANLMLN
jgi:putative peptide zinc metalloprotease protein